MYLAGGWPLGDSRGQKKSDVHEPVLDRAFGQISLRRGSLGDRKREEKRTGKRLLGVLKQLHSAALRSLDSISRLVGASRCLVGAYVCGSVLLDVGNVLRAFQLTVSLVSPFK